jgi:putative transposase
MANTYSQLYIQCVFAPRFRDALLQPEWDAQLRAYITGTVQNNGHKMMAINNMPDHLHLFVSMSPKQSVSEMMQLVKGDSSEWINKKRLTAHKFNWQEGFGAFSYSKSQANDVIGYIARQQEHHQQITFLDEYKLMLKRFEIEHNERYIFKLPE